MTKERPILFSGPMVRAILAGKKSHTRRLSGLKAINERPDDFEYQGFDRGEWHFYDCRENKLVTIKCPYGQPGDVLWCKETFAVAGVLGNKVQLNYMADDRLMVLDNVGYDERQWAIKYERRGKRPSIHMPRWASRLSLPLKSVRVERVQDISEEDCYAEGIEWRANPEGDDDGHDPWREFADLWDSINGKTYPFSSNPRVWVLEFERVQG